MSSTEREPLLASTSKKTTGVAENVVVVASVPIPPAEAEIPKDLNQVSRRKLVWILGALWIAVFLGAMDGTIVATLQQPIGDYFKQSHKASYIGTSYLLSICCFTP
ncbi:hypothetical protein FRB91_000450 [Serendipita sp. 411]|nr:hypothetical protein FRC15_000882 [Serendipita sp. 397]KAG8856677.1 hypothetical protein FRB91_000450 [Serendipita sp. 411]KAG8869818.1 hypothetical protein FRC20_000813 [Serendipita sp. 405]